MGHSGMLVIENQRSDWLASVVSEKLRLSFSHLRLLTNLSFLRMIDYTKLANVLQRRTTQEISRKISCGYVQNISSGPLLYYSTHEF